MGETQKGKILIIDRIGEFDPPGRPRETLIWGYSHACTIRGGNGDNEQSALEE